MDSEARVLVSMATYNERENLPALLADIQGRLPSADILIVDDNSPDGTGQLADELARQDPRIHVIHRAGKLGLGSAILAGMRFAQQERFDYFINMDADYSHHPRYLPALLAGMADHDIMIGSRYIPGGGVANWPWSRRFMSWGINVLARLLLRLPAKDTSGGFRSYRVALLRRVDDRRLLSHGYSFQEEFLFLCRQAGGRIGETPILFDNRIKGTSKVNVREIVRSLGVIGYLGLCALFGVGEGARQ